MAPFKTTVSKGLRAGSRARVPVKSSCAEAWTYDAFMLTTAAVERAAILDDAICVVATESI